MERRPPRRSPLRPLLHLRCSFLRHPLLFHRLLLPRLVLKQTVGDLPHRLHEQVQITFASIEFPTIPPSFLSPGAIPPLVSFSSWPASFLMTSTTASSSSSPSSTFLDGAVVIPDDSLVSFQSFSPPSSGSHSPSELFSAEEMALLSSPACGALPEPLSTVNSSPASTITPLYVVGPPPPSSSLPDGPPPISSDGPNRRLKSRPRPMQSLTARSTLELQPPRWIRGGERVEMRAMILAGRIE